MLKLKLQYFGHLMLRTLKRPWCWEWLKAGGEGDDRGWDGWMASPIQWTWVWVNSWSWWWTGRPSVLQLMGLQRVAHSWATELTDACCLVVSDSCDPSGCSPPVSSAHGISQARILGQIAISFSRGSYIPRDGTQVSCIGRWILTTETPGKPSAIYNNENRDS